jgi:hypothetical protein
MKIRMIGGVLLMALSVLAFAQLGDLIKVIGIGAAVDRFGPDINRAVNRLQGFSDNEAMMTKVVPILSVGKGTHIGAAQVMGPPALVKKVKAVAQLEGDFAGKVVRIKALIPIESKDVVRDIKRVPGVGVSAVIDIKV